MIVIEIPTNPNCARVDTRVFHDVGPPQPVRQVRLEREPGHAQWYEVTGWMVAGARCPAMVQKVEDSGEGVAFLLYGGDAGLRLQPAGGHKPWRLDDPDQWGEPFMLIPDLTEVQDATPAEK